MQPLYHELSILTKALHHKNLSAAALHVGLSQPQLSRIIARIEQNYNIVLLDRTAKRKSGWTPIAFQMAEMFEKNQRSLELDLQGVSRNQIMSELHVGALEGLSSLALRVAHAAFETIGIHRIIVDIYDLSELEAHFLSGHLDVVFTAKTPAKQKYKYLEQVGWQKWEKIKSNEDYGVYSSFEYGHTPPKERSAFKHVLVSNSLSVKKEWFERVGGMGVVPSDPQKGRTPDGESVLMIGSELLSPILWEQLTQIVPV